MYSRQLYRSLIAASVFASSLTAQRARTPAPSPAPHATDVVTRLFILEYLRPEHAAKLVAPFVERDVGGGVFDAGSAVRGITVRAQAQTIARVDSMLRLQDRPAPIITLQFQIIAAVDSAAHDPAIADVDAALRSLFKFGGYRLIAQGSVTIAEPVHGLFELTLSGDDERFSVTGNAQALIGRTDTPSRAGTTGNGMATSAQLTVRLSGEAVAQTGRGTSGVVWGTLLSTGLSVPIGETVVLGSTGATKGRRAMILTVRPESKLPSLKR